MARLIYRNGPHPGLSVELRAGLNRVGRNPANDIQILDSSISGFHCEIQVSEMCVAFRDVGSRNGSFLDGQRITKEILVPGKVLRIGLVDFDLEVPHVNIAIPDRPKVEEAFANFLEDGTAACQNHATLPATQKCDKCEKFWCDSCVRATGLVGGAQRTISCMECGAHCTPLNYVAPKKKKSFFDAIGATIRLKRPGS